MSIRMKKRMYALLMSILALLIVIIFIVIGKIQPEGEYITKDEMVVLTELLNIVWDEHIESNVQDVNRIQIQKETMAVLEEMVSGWDVEEYVTYGQFKQWKEEIDSAMDISEGKEDGLHYKKYPEFPFWCRMPGQLDQPGHFFAYKALLILPYYQARRYYEWHCYSGSAFEAW